MYFEVLKRFDGGKSVPLLDPISEMEIDCKSLSKLIESRKQIVDQMSDKKDISSKQISIFDRKAELQDSIKLLTDSIKKSSEMIMSTELVSMKRVMRRLDLCDKNDVPTLKGKVAAHISTSDEILLTEMIFSGMFNDIEKPSHIAAVLSCLVYTEGKSGSSEQATRITKHEKLGQPFMLL